VGSIWAIVCFLLTSLAFQNLVLKTAASETYVSYELLEVLIHSEGSKKFVAGFVKRKKLGEEAISR
jgi:hypothetical protein